MYPQPNHLATIYHSQLVHLNEDTLGYFDLRDQPQKPYVNWGMSACL